MIKIVEVYMAYTESGVIPLESEIKLTGRWKIVTDNEISSLFIEKKGIFFNSWVNGDNVEIHKIHEYINNCGDK